jgi:hypothetical protein
MESVSTWVHKHNFVKTTSVMTMINAQKASDPAVEDEPVVEGAMPPRLEGKQEILVEEEDEESSEEESEGETGRCPNCGEFGALGCFCDSCEDTGMIYDTFDRKELSDLVFKTEDGEVECGQCPNCGELGAMGCLCDTCEDSGMIYDKI